MHNILDIVEIVDCWVITGQEMIAEVRHLKPGLLSGTIMQSERTGLTWKVKIDCYFIMLLTNK